MTVALLAHATPAESSLVLLSLIVGLVVGGTFVAYLRIRSRR